MTADVLWQAHTQLWAPPAPVTCREQLREGRVGHSRSACDAVHVLEAGGVSQQQLYSRGLVVPGEAIAAL